MAALFAILRALWRAVQRELGTFESITTNNFFLFVAVLVYGALNSGQSPKSAEPFFVLLGFILLFPLSADPLSRIPSIRKALWPLTRRQRFELRLASLLLSPVTWVAVLILLKTASLAMTLAFVALAIILQGALAIGRRIALRQPQWGLLRHIPRFPGRIGGLVRKNVREILTVLDPYVALLLAAGGSVYRFFNSHPDPAAFPIIGLLAALAMSTYAQSLFGLDYCSGLTRYRLLPLRGWEILLAKDAAFLGILLILLLPLDPLPGMTLGLVALAVGHHSSVLLYLPHERWRFTGGRLLPVGVLQALLGLGLGFAEIQHGIVVLITAVAGFLGSLFYYGRCWDRRRRMADDQE